MTMDALIKRLKKHESLCLTVYPDLDKWAIGYGHQCSQDHPPITAEQAEEYLREDIYKASDVYMKWKAQHGLKLSTVRDEVLVEMIFWHGFRGFLGFRKMCQAVIAGNYELAAKEMLDSESGRKYKARMYELSVLMSECVWCGESGSLKKVQKMGIKLDRSKLWSTGEPSTDNTDTKHTHSSSICLAPGGGGELESEQRKNVS